MSLARAFLQQKSGDFVEAERGALTQEVRHVQEVLGPVPVADLPLLLQEGPELLGDYVVWGADAQQPAAQDNALVGAERLVYADLAGDHVRARLAGVEASPVPPFVRQRVADPGGVRCQGLPLSGRLAPHAVHAHDDARLPSGDGGDPWAGLSAGPRPPPNLPERLPEALLSASPPHSGYMDTPKSSAGLSAASEQDSPAGGSSSHTAPPPKATGATSSPLPYPTFRSGTATQHRVFNVSLAHSMLCSI